MQKTDSRANNKLYSDKIIARPARISKFLNFESKHKKHRHIVYTGTRRNYP